MRGVLLFLKCSAAISTSLIFLINCPVAAHPDKGMDFTQQRSDHDHDQMRMEGQEPIHSRDDGGHRYNISSLIK